MMFIIKSNRARRWFVCLAATALNIRGVRRASVLTAVLGWSTAAMAAPLDPNSFASLGTLMPTGDVTINTTTGELTYDSTTFNGVESNGMMVFTFDLVRVGASITVDAAGSRPFAMLSHSDLQFSGTMNLAGANGSFGGTNAGGAGGDGGPGGARGGNGGRQFDAPQSGSGTGGGGAGTSTSGANDGSDGGGGGFSGAGGMGDSGAGGGLPGGAAGITYGDLLLTLEGGSGGGGGGGRFFNPSTFLVGGGGGGGGGAIELGAVDAVLVTGQVDASGGNGEGGVSGGGGGGGSGGGILIHGEEVSLAAATLTAAGRGGSSGGGGGGGGRILIDNTTYVVGPAPTISVAAGGGGSTAAMPGTADLYFQRIAVENTTFDPTNPSFAGLTTTSVPDEFEARAGGTISISGASHVVPQRIVIADPTGALSLTDSELSTGAIVNAGNGDLTLTNSTLLLGGPGSNFGSNPVTIGNSGPATVVILDGADATFSSLNIAAAGIVRLTGGTLAAQDFTNSGSFDWSSGEVNVTGAGGLAISPGGPLGNELHLASGRFLRVTNTLTVESDSQLILLDENVMSVGDVQNDGTTAVLASSVDFGGGFLNKGDLVLVHTIVTGDVTNPADVAINVIGDVTFEGLVSGAGGIFGSGTATFNGGHNPGDSPGIVNIEGNLIYGANNVLTLELAGVDSGEHVQVQVAGSASLGGALNVMLIDDFIPNAGQSFTLITTDDVDGVFATELLPSVPGLSFDVIYNPQSVVLQVLAAGLTGDYNANGNVDAADYTLWRDTLGSTTDLTADGDGDNVIDADDYNVWKTNFGQTVATDGSVAVATEPPVATNSVPEPTIPWLALLPAFLIYRRLRR